MSATETKTPQVEANTEDQGAIAPNPPVLTESYVILRPFRDDTGMRKPGELVPVSEAKTWRRLSQLVSQRYVRLE